MVSVPFRPLQAGFQNNYYKVLKVNPDTCTSVQIKKAYHRIARIIHPDKCSHPQATDAMGVVTSAHSTLSNAALRAGYDMYAAQVEVDSAGSDTFAQWESKGGANMAHLPPWFVRGLNHPVVGPVLMFFIILLMLAAAVFFLVLFLAYFVVHMIFWFLCCFGCCGHCWPRYGEGARLHAKRQERFMRMLQDYEAEVMAAQAKGETMPDPNVFFANWNAAHPEEENDRDGIPTANVAENHIYDDYGSIPRA